VTDLNESLSTYCFIQVKELSQRKEALCHFGSASRFCPHLVAGKYFPVPGSVDSGNSLRINNQVGAIRQGNA